MKKKLIWIIGIIVILLLVLTAYIVKQTSNDNDKKSDGYDTYQVKEESPLNISGKASPSKIKTYNNNDQLGDLVSTLVEDGEKVKQGDNLINYNINDQKRQDLSSKVNDAQNVVNQDYQNINQQPNNNDLQKKLNQDLNALNEAQKELSQYTKQINDSTYASFDGVIEMDNDTDAASGESILKLIANETQIKSSVSEFDVNKIKVGDSVNIKVNSTGEKGHGKITKISELPSNYEEKGATGAGMSQGDSEEGSSQASNPVSNNPTLNKDNSKYQVTIGKIDLPIRSGFSTEAEIPIDAIKLPKSVLTRNNDVFVLNKDNKVEKRHLNIERQNGEIFVKKGLKKGEKLIVSPKKSLNNGDKVEVSS